MNEHIQYDLWNTLTLNYQNSIYNSSPISLISRTADLTNAIQPYLYLDFAQHHFTDNIYHDSIRIKVLKVCDKVETTADAGLCNALFC